jgi:hypothetical protein
MTSPTTAAGPASRSTRASRARSIHWRGYRQELVDTEERHRRVLFTVRHRGERDGREIDERLALLFYLDDEGRIERWEPWSDVDAARAALRV